MTQKVTLLSTLHRLPEKYHDEADGFMKGNDGIVSPPKLYTQLGHYVNEQAALVTVTALFSLLEDNELDNVSLFFTCVHHRDGFDEFKRDIHNAFIEHSSVRKRQARYHIPTNVFITVLDMNDYKCLVVHLLAL